MIGSAIRFSACVSTLVGLLAATSAHAQTPAPVYSWTGFYIGAQVGGAWGDRSVGRTANDNAIGSLLNGALFGPDHQPMPPTHGLRTTGVTGGIDFGYNWQIAPRWVAGIEADFSLSDIGGSGNASSALAPSVLQEVNAEQQIDWWGTVRARLGWLATPDLMLFGTAGLAFGKVTNSASYGASGPSVPLIVSYINPPTYSLSCTINSTCLAGSESSVKTGWTVGAGGEWRWSERWSLKAEYLYVNLGATSVDSTALQVLIPGDIPSSYTAHLGRTDFHVARLGVNYRF